MGNKQTKMRDPIDAQYMRPSGTLYTSCEWDERTVRRLIIERKIAPFYPGQDQPAPDREECPICMMVSAARAPCPSKRQNHRCCAPACRSATLAASTGPCAANKASAPSATCRCEPRFFAGVRQP